MSRPSDSRATNEAAGELLKDVLFGGALVALGVFLLVWIVETPAGFASATTAIDFDTVPILCSTGLILLSAVYLMGRVRALLAHRRNAGGPLVPPATRPSALFWQRLITVVVLIAYAVALRHLPFFVATLALLAALFAVYGQRSPIRIAAVSVLGSAALTLLFIYALNLPV